MSNSNRIMVIDDVESIRLSVKAVLAEATGLPIDCASGLADTQRLLAQHADQYLAAVVDLHLPDAKSGEAVDLVLAQSIPVIVLTGDLDENLRNAISFRPIVDYVIKQSINAFDIVSRDILRLQRNKGRKLLIVDRSAGFRRYLIELLTPQGLSLLEAEDSSSALKMIEQHPETALCLIDYQTPTADGTVLTHALRARYSAAQMALIGVTESTDPFIAVRFLKSGADDLVRKPFLPEELVSRVNHCLDNLDNIATIIDLANHDYLTRLYNRCYLFEAGNKLFRNAAREHFQLMVAILDLDHFKRINDTWGHEAGDAVLKAVASELMGSLRSADMVARIGGEEFCIVALNVDNPLQLVETIRKRIEALEIPFGDTSLRITASAGVTCQLADSLEGTMRLADTALYQAKSDGRNCTRLAKPEHS